MGKNKSKSSQKKQQPTEAAAVAAVADKKQPRVSMEDIQAMSDSDDQGSLPPEEEWNDEAKNLRDAIMSGKFDHVLEREDGDASSVEEVELDNDGEAHDEVDAEGSSAEDEEETGPSDEDSEADSEDEVEKVPTWNGKKTTAPLVDAAADSSDDDDASENEHEAEASKPTLAAKGLVEDENSGRESNEEEQSDDDEDDTPAAEKTMDQKNQINSKALHVVTQELASQKQGWSWAETFEIIPATPLPFDKKTTPEDELVDIHDDLKREVTFYDIALEAVNAARLKCQEHEIPFTRPEDFFAEMVKTDDHMAKIKDRLIFENKKIDAVAMRKSNKEQKLRVKESQANRAAEKSKRKREHFKSLDDWQASGAAGSRNDGALMDALEGSGPNKKRMSADKKYGFGGQRPRFKQNDRKDLNDTSKFNPRGNFAGGMKRTASSSKKGGSNNRPGKRARDAKRSS
ncbi:hypothetical protein MPSEU_000953500 [Mayamaea pseudoterrestris]|nr:hypothetical protein MPSEU_000953500 [Mayamaea pseudoterrestris]